jgi:F0F1-type ATP synthase membrane subunit b/b'
MNRSLHTVSVVLVAGSLAVGCEDAAEKQRQADQAQAEANQKKAAAEVEAMQKAARANNEAEQQIANAQRKADQKQNEATASLTKEQIDRLSKVNDALDDLRAKIGELQFAANAETAGSKQADDGHVLNDLVARRDTLSDDASAVPSSTPTSWPALQDKIDKDLDSYRSLARTASAHIKSAPR